MVQEDDLPSRPRIRQRIPEPHQLGIFDGCLLIDEHDILAKLRVELLEPSPFRRRERRLLALQRGALAVESRFFDEHERAGLVG